MINLNILPPAYKNILKNKQLINGTKYFFVYIVLFTILSAIILLVAKMLLQNVLIESTESAAATNIKSAESAQIANINKKITQAKTIQEGYIPWSRFIIKFSKLIPNKVVIYSLNVIPTDESQWEITMTGNAVSRDAYLKLKENLVTAENLFTNVDFPKTDPLQKFMIQKENINFNINIKITKEVLTNLSLE